MPLDTQTLLDRERRLLRAIVLATASALVVLPPLASFFIRPSIALPASVGGIAAASLLAATGALTLMRQRFRHAARQQTRADAGEARSALLDACPGLVLILDANAQVTAVGGRDCMAMIGGLRPLVGRGLVEQIHVSDRLAFLQGLDRLRLGETGTVVDLRLERQRPGEDADQFLHVRADLSSLSTLDAGQTGIFVQLRDIAADARERKETAQRIAEIEDANLQKNRFLAAVSHELRTPLNAILGFSDILIGEYFGPLPDGRQREYVQLIRDSGAHLLSVVNTMLDMSKIESGRYELMIEPFPIGEAVRSCEDMLALQAQNKGVTLASRLPRDLGEISADRRAIQQILINLVGNAVKFTDKGGVVTIDALRRGDTVLLSVSDTGIGMAPEVLERLGQPFMQVQNDYTRRYEGTGLGLALVKGLVALHGGLFNIESKPGQGTVVTVTLPADGHGQVEMFDHAVMVEFPPRLNVKDDDISDDCGMRDNGTGTARTA